MLCAKAFQRWTGLCLLLLAILIAPGCESLFLGETRQDKKIEGLKVTHEQLRLSMRSLVHPMTGIIQDTADEIMAETKDPAIREAALRWKATAVPTIRETLFSPMPLVALFDTWAFSYQMMDYFQTGPGVTQFKEYAPLGYEAAKAINVRMKDLYQEITVDHDVDEARKLIMEWDHNNPISGDVDNRESIYNQADKISLALGLSFRDSVDAMVTNVDDLNRKLDVYSDQIPEQARWQAEIFAHQAMGTLKLDGVVEQLPTFMKSAEATMAQADTTLASAQTTLDGMPDMMTAQREALMAQVSQEREIVMKQVNTEIEQAMAEIQKMSEQMTQQITAEREAMQVFISQERKITMSEIGVMRQRLVDGFFYKMLILLILTAIFLSILSYIIVRSFKKPVATQN